VQAKERGTVERKIIFTHNLGDGVWPVPEWVELLMGPYKAFFLQVQPKFFAHLKLMWHPMLIVALLILGIGPKVYPDTFKEDFGSGLCSDVLLASGQNRHLGNAINNHKNIVIAPLGGREARHVVH
jgi:hypothetical protein